MQACSGGTQRHRGRSLPPSPHSPLLSNCVWTMLLLQLIMTMGGGVDAATTATPIPTAGPGETCVMRGICGQFNLGGNTLLGIPCGSPSVPERLTNVTSKNYLREVCPSFNADEPLCCDDANLKALHANFETAKGVLGGCPVCLRNFFDLWCRYTCSPRQSEFVHFQPDASREPIKLGKDPAEIFNTDGPPLVDEVTFVVNASYARAILESCARVRMSTNFAMMSVCQMSESCINGDLSDKCIKDCLDYLGTPRAMTFQPTKIIYHLEGSSSNTSPPPFDWNHTAVTSDLPLSRCHDGPDACSCADCSGSCKPTPHFLREFEDQWEKRKGVTKEVIPKKKSDPKASNETSSDGVEVVKNTSPWSGVSEWLGAKSGIYGYPVYAVIAFGAGCLCASVIVFCMFKADSKKRRGDKKENVKFAGTYWGLRDILDNLQRGGAEWYAKKVADHTRKIGWITILILCIICPAGLCMQNLIYDPMEVWTQPDSRSRVEKATFDGYFNPLPRYTQVIIRPMQTYNKPYRVGFKNYGPIFNHFVMQQAFELTQALINLRGRGPNAVTGKEEDLGLADVCYKMVDNHCFVLSPFSYLQNNQTLLDCANMGCTPVFDKKVKEVKEEREKEKEKAEKAENSTEEASRDAGRIMVESFYRTFPDGKIPNQEVEVEKSEEEDPFDDLEEDKKRRKREAPSGHRSRSKRHHPIDVKVNSSHPEYEERREQKSQMDRGFGVLAHLLNCIEVPIASSAYLNMECGSGMGGAPVPGNLVFGGWHEAGAPSLSEVEKISHYSDAYVITIGLDARKRPQAELWERTAIDMLKKYTNEYVEVNFITHISIEDEIKYAARADVIIMGLAYLLMSVYIMFALSQCSVDNRKGFLKHTLTYQIVPGLMVSVTIAASCCLVGAFYGYIGVRATLMCLEVQPFLLCAIGINNIFYFVKTYQRKMHERKQKEGAMLSPRSGPSRQESTLALSKSGQTEDGSDSGSQCSQEERKARDIEEVEDRIRREVLIQTCHRVLPSMFCTAFTECVCFLSLGLSDAPVLKVFSFYASLGVFVNFLLTLMIFVPFFYLCMQCSASPNGTCTPVDCLSRSNKGMRRSARRRFDAIRSSRGWMPHLTEKYVAPTLYSWIGRYTMIIILVLAIAISIVFIPQWPIGLDEKLSVPVDSYVHKFMSVLPNTLATAMPVHFVVHNKSRGPLDVTDEKFMKLFCTHMGCAEDSLGNLIGAAVKATRTDLISQPAMNWIDDYRKFRSTSSSGSSCCLLNTNPNLTREYCTIEEANRNGGVSVAGCEACLPQGANQYTDMTRDLRRFTTLLPTVDCGMSGGMAHREAISTNADGNVTAFYLRSFHRTFRNSSDYVDGLKLSRLIAEQFKEVLVKNGYKDVEVFPYSMYYVYYDQYLVIAVSTTSQLALSAGIAFIALMLTTVSPTTALIVAANTLSSTLMLICYMVWMGIELNALTIVNLAMSLGIDLEFFVHLCFAYANSGKVDRIGRATDALVNVGSTVFSGIIFTKAVGLLVLYNAQSQIFKIYYFSFYFGLLLIGSVHGLIFLPVMLTFWGPDTYLRRYLEQNDRASLTGGDQQQGSDENGRADSSQRCLIQMAISKASSRGPSTHTRINAAITPATTQMTTQSQCSHRAESGSLRRPSSPSAPSVPSTADHESAPLVEREDSLRSHEGLESV